MTVQRLIHTLGFILIVLLTLIFQIILSFFFNIFLGNLHFTTTTTTKNPIRHKQRTKHTDQSVHMNNNADKNFLTTNI